MIHLPNKVTNFIFISILLILSLIIIPHHNLTYATDKPQAGSSKVTATVADITSPSVPILVSPNNNSTLNSASPTFIWEPSVDNVAIHYYDFYLDDNKNRSNIDSSNAITISTTANSALIDGQHTWKIKAIDTSGNTNTSATWTFTIDTTPPIILISQIASESVNLSSQDSSSIPSNYSISTSDQTPEFIGSSETNAIITLGLTNSYNTYSFETNTLTSTSFNITPDLNIPGGEYTISVSSTDLAGNTTTLPSFILQITNPSPATYTIQLPSPLPDIKLPKLPFTLQPQQKIQIPQALIAIPIQTQTSIILSYLPWIIILILLINTYLLIKKQNITIYNYILLSINIIILLYLSLITLHWLPLTFTLLHLIVLF